MRQIGHLESEIGARTFGDYLYVQGIDNQIESEKGLGWALWVREEEKLERARALLAEYRTNPNDPKYQLGAQAASGLRDAEKRAEAAHRKKVESHRYLFRPLHEYGFGPLTLVLICVSVAVFILTKFGREPQNVIRLYISEFDVASGGLSRLQGLPEVKHGEFWRLFTPMFVHFHILHIFFNMLWLRDLGSMIEARQSSRLFTVLVLAIAAISNFAQYLVGGPGFGGMSGVVYGLLGYVWIRGKLDPGSGLFLHPSTVTMMVIWFFVCLTGYLGPIANTAHGAGLVMGMAWGCLSSLRHR